MGYSAERIKCERCGLEHHETDHVCDTDIAKCFPTKGHPMTTLTKERVEHFREPLKRQIRRDTILHIPISDEMKAVDQLIDLALRGLEVTQEDETAWLVEAFSGQTENYFAGLDEIWNGGFSLYPRWTADHMKAIRFTRKEDAETIVSVMDSTAKCRAVEHSWMASPPISEENCSGHVASENDAKVCGRCGVHIDSFRPDLPTGGENE